MSKFTMVLGEVGNFRCRPKESLPRIKAFNNSTKRKFQPSGQSVALQSMSLGIPVMITETKGFWQKEVYF